MKILAIRGKNLASLSAEFEIDFLSEPLASAGLYAITGPTGSGKSTLLDALCLALYERTPRLMKATAKGESIPDVGDNTVSPSDPRTILRRGAGECFAEVDFVGTDGVPYRSRWGVRRARSKGEGKLQASEITLTRITDGQRLGDHTKTATLNLIEKHIGLSFDQFTRAVLLAQNDFATFLKASDDDRAELLQTLTGTETFSDISKRAFERMKRENEALQLLQLQLKDQMPLPPEERAEKSAQLTIQADKSNELEAAKSIVESHLRWYEQWAKHQADITSANETLNAAIAENLNAAPRKSALSLTEQVQSARPFVGELSRLGKAVNDALTEQGKTVEELAQVTETELICQTAFDQAKKISDDSLQTRELAQPDLNKAKALDATIAALEPQVVTAKQAHAQAQTRQGDAIQVQSEIESKIKLTRDSLESSQNWLEENKKLQPLAQGWQRWETLFGQAQTTLSSQIKGDAELVELSAKAAGNLTELGVANKAVDDAISRANKAESQLVTATEACAELDTDKLAQDKKAQESQRDQLLAASLLLQQRTEVKTQLQKFQTQKLLHEGTLKMSEAELLDCTNSQPELEAKLGSAEHALQLANLAAGKDATSIRAQLQAEQPCPVCGSLEHPYSDHSPVVDAVLQSLGKHVKSSKEALSVLHVRSTRASTQKDAAVNALDALTIEIADAKMLQTQVNSAWAVLQLSAQIDGLPEQEQGSWLQTRQQEVSQEIHQFNLQETTHRDLLKQKEEAQKSVTISTKSVNAAKQVQSELSSLGEQFKHSIDVAQGNAKALTGQLEEALLQLDGAFDDISWREQWRAEPIVYVSGCGEKAKNWLHQTELKNGLTIDLQKLGVQKEAAESAAKSATELLTTQAASLETVNSLLTERIQDRGLLFQGKAASDVEAELKLAVESAAQGLSSAQDQLQNARSVIARAEEANRQAGILWAKFVQEQSVAQEGLLTWLKNFNAQRNALEPNGSEVADLTQTNLEPLLAHDENWISQERSSLQKFQSAVESGQAVLASQNKTMALHETAKSTQEDQETLGEQLLAIAQSAASLAEEISALKIAISMDDGRLNASESIRFNIEQQSGITRVWSQLGELIGSADGKKFRNFAQQLTLDILLGYGNRHLHSLTSRYRLMRIKDSLGLLVVDQDMGDEVRSVHSLSGGESFLVSLAMALGLASLSSHRVQVESLFIDEGFGSLDSDSLRVAMDALDNLQAQGRKVGVISHVQEMTERIGTRVQVQRQSAGVSRIVVC